MGTWGTGISSNDIYTDVFADFFDLYDSGMSVEEISVRLIDANQETIADPDSENNFWFALAQAQWECRQLDASVFDKVRTIIETGADLEVWQ
ncbi:MAG: hypothetical protein JO301_05500, partial [Chitinophagaceae bacterium]|nr:hypothetical protein [Chitinophagaceae bacterium]